MHYFLLLGKRIMTLLASSFRFLRCGSDLLRKPCYLRLLTPKSLHYVQGQAPNPKTREYFYFIDHQGQLFLDDAKMKNFTSCFKEKDFLVFFFKRLKINTSGKYEDEFPYLSPCGREKNYIRCDDTPIVFTHVIEGEEKSSDLLAYNGAGNNLTVNFEPENVCMLPQTGRVYHPAPGQYGGIGLIKSSLAIEFSKFFEFASADETQPPTHFTWKGRRIQLTNSLFDLVKHREFIGCDH